MSYPTSGVQHTLLNIVGLEEVITQIMIERRESAEMIRLGIFRKGSDMTEADFKDKTKVVKVYRLPAQTGWANSLDYNGGVDLTTMGSEKDSVEKGKWAQAMWVGITDMRITNADEGVTVESLIQDVFNADPGTFMGRYLVNRLFERTDQSAGGYIPTGLTTPRSAYPSMKTDIAGPLTPDLIWAGIQAFSPDQRGVLMKSGILVLHQNIYDKFYNESLLTNYNGVKSAAVNFSESRGLTIHGIKVTPISISEGTYKANNVPFTAKGTLNSGMTPYSSYIALPGAGNYQTGLMATAAEYTPQVPPNTPGYNASGREAGYSFESSFALVADVKLPMPGYDRMGVYRISHTLN